MAIKPLSTNFQSQNTERASAKDSSSIDSPTQNRNDLQSERNESAQVQDKRPVAEVRAEIDKLANSNELIQRSLRFKVDDTTGRSVISVIDRETNKTIRQIPPEELLTLSRRLKEINEELDSTSGLLLKTEA